MTSRRSRRKSQFGDSQPVPAQSPEIAPEPTAPKNEPPTRPETITNAPEAGRLAQISASPKVPAMGETARTAEMSSPTEPTPALEPNPAALAGSEKSTQREKPPPDPADDVTEEKPRDPFPPALDGLFTASQ